MTTADPQKIGPDGLEQATGIKFRRTVDLATSGVAIIALAGLFGFVPGLQLLGSIRPGYIPMAPSTAACFLIFSTALFLRARKFLQGIRLMAATVLVLLVMAFCLLELAEAFVHIDLNLSDKLFPSMGMLGTIPVGRMSSATAATFVIAGLSTLLLMLRSRGSRSIRHPGNWASGLGALTMLVGATVLLAYLYGAPLMYDAGSVPMAATTALAFLFLGVALAASPGSESFLMRRMSGDSTSAVLSRVFIPLIVSIVILQSLISRYISTSFVVNDAIIKALLIIAIVIITAAVVVRVASSTGGNIDEVNRKLRQALKNLVDGEEQHRTILQTAMDGFWLLDMQGHILEVNETLCRMVGYSAQELQVKPISDLEVAESADEIADHFQKIIVQGEDRFESWFRCKDGRIIDVEVSAQYRPVESGFIVAFLRDITERKRAEEILRKKDADIEQFLYTVSHDLRSPLVTVKTFMGYLEKDISDGNQEHLTQDIQFIHGAADKMKLMLDELLELSRIGRVETPMVSVSLRDVLAETLVILAGSIRERKLDIRIPDSVLMLFGERPRLCQIWQNLIENAIKYSRDDCILRIELGVQQMSGETVFSVRDNGIGIDPQYHSKIFGIFEKLDPKSPGAGLGLSMVLRIVEKCGGRIWVESEGIDKGSCFFFTLPHAVVQSGLTAGKHPSGILTTHKILTDE